MKPAHRWILETFSGGSQSRAALRGGTVPCRQTGNYCGMSARVQSSYQAPAGIGPTTGDGPAKPVP